MSKRIGLYGGSFNPPTLSHLDVAKISLDNFNLDELIIMPAGVPPHKGKLEISGEHRLKMSKLCFSVLGKVCISDMEIKKKGPSYTIDTLDILSKTYSNNEIILIVGSDTAEKVSRWHNSEKLHLYTNEIIIMQRSGEDCREAKKELLKLVNKVSIYEKKPDSTSSTLVRNHLAQGHDTLGMLSEDVLAYIKKHNLYVK